MTTNKPIFLWKYTDTNSMTLYIEVIAPDTRREC